MNAGLKYSNETNGATSALSFCSQKLITLFLTRVLNCCFVGGEERWLEGWGRLYFRHKSQIWKNQDLDMEVEKLKNIFGMVTEDIAFKSSHHAK